MHNIKSVVSEIKHITAGNSINPIYRIVCKPLHKNRAQSAIFNDEGGIKPTVFTNRT